jgi:ABC-type transport system involved in cytochrome bd biosynthesis, fused ATPase and permease components
VTIAGEDIRNYRQEDVRATFALAGQEAHVFDSSIRENLRIGRPGASDEELDDALAQAQLADWVATLPDGARHARRRGGNRALRRAAPAARARACAALARAGARLDEPTAHLDPPTAERLMDDVLDAAGNRTVLLITHRREGLARMDEVVSL